MDVPADLEERATAWQAAIERRDPGAAALLMEAGYCLVLVEPVRFVAEREGWLRTLADYYVHEWQVDERIVDVDGALAVIHQRVLMRATVNGQDRSGSFIITDVWRLSAGEWRVWRRYSTPRTPGQPMPAG